MSMNLRQSEQAPLLAQREQLPVPKDALLYCYQQAIAHRHYPGYPVQADRLFLDQIPHDAHGHIALGDSGPWVAGAPLPTRAEQLTDVLHNIGYPKMCVLDADYRPLHPWWRDMVQNPAIGGVVGKGFYYNWGANYTADAAVIAHDARQMPHLLLIQRSDTGEWALPGGFINAAESSKAAAVRELHEETRLHLDSTMASAHKLYTGPVLDIRTTLHAWTETNLWLFKTSLASLPTIHAGDDARNAQWVALTDMPHNLYGSHPVLVDMVLSQI